MAEPFLDRNDFAANFSKSYIAAGRLGFGRALVIVKAAFGSTGFSTGPNSASLNKEASLNKSWYNQTAQGNIYSWPSLSTTLVMNWAADTRCSQQVANATYATAAVQDDPITSACLRRRRIKLLFSRSTFLF